MQYDWTTGHTGTGAVTFRYQEQWTRGNGVTSMLIGKQRATAAIATS